MLEFQVPQEGPAINQSTSLWVEINAYKYSPQSSNVRSPNAVRHGALEGVFRFLAPSDIQLNLDHNWAEYENITSRMANIVSNWAVPIQDIKSAYTNTTGKIWGALTGQGGGSTAQNPGTNSTVNTIANALSNFLSGDVVNYRIDAPLVYKGTANLEYNLNFDLALFTERPSYIEEILRSLMKFSSPKKDGDNFLSIIPPHIFSVKTIPGGLINLKYAALKTIQPEMSYPYVNGKPTVCKLQLTFQDITPLFSDTFDVGSSVTVTGGPRIQ